ncbi:DUF2125 domain-containing protein [Paracoccus spongiarum]|uniref:DUF2125 domain-containing protein n=1 Tax=Paracoccus spongiarum TaxID=3064387 RepID=A0ABT9JB14_9RHOB|nr:DUF2125 domain-containing protein [Paracoccus sp. 2205BS29-5]MDP5306998.1 DUF2125 domain-containing protein [Paracoccus sp. 2205BS29-5]
MFRPLATSALALVLGAAPALSEVTPAQVWDDIARYYGDLGYEVTIGQRDEAGDRLALRDIAMTSTSGQTTVTVQIPGITLQKAGDARVRSVIDGQVSARMVADAAEEADDLDLQVLMSVPGNEMLSSGEPADMLHEITIPQVDVEIRPDAADAAGDAPVRLGMRAVDATYQSRTGPGSESLYEITADTLDLAMQFAEIASPSGAGEQAPAAGAGGDAGGADVVPGSFSAGASVDGVIMTGSMVAPRGGAPLNMAERPHEAFRDGLAISGRIAMGPLEGSAEFEAPDSEGAMQSGSARVVAARSEISVGLARSGMTYAGSSAGTRVEMSNSDLPMPLSYAVESASGKLVLPMSASDQPQPFGLDYAITGLTLADGIWQLFDPEGKLPRDPANLTLKLDGQAIVTEDFLDPAFAERMAEAPDPATDTDPTAPAEGDPADATAPETPVPFQPQSLSITTLALDAAGARADVTGKLEFTGEGGQPVGTVEGSFTGINALLDTLVAIGIVPAEQQMAARMMIAMFARPAEGDPDALQTRLEFREDGAIFANGQQVR